MLKHEILKTIQMMKNTGDNDLIPFEMHGELNVRAWRDGQLFYHDGGDNTITIWAKHSMIHLLSGDVFSNIGTVGKTLVSLSSSNHSNSAFVNTDGMLISQNQYWWDGENAWNGQWSESSGDLGVNYDYPFFPTKMLFGTGKEYTSWTHVLSAASADEQIFLAETWADAASFNNNISLSDNYYSGTVYNNPTYQKYGNYPIVQTRTVNDYLSGKIEGSPDQNEYGVVGAIKDGTLDSVDPTKLETGYDDLLLAEYRGVGKPCFIYCKRDIKWNDSSAEVFLSNEGLGYENKITFTVNMPDQTSASSAEGWFYPYNGYDLKEVGLFNDTLLTIGGIADNNYPYQNMMCGTMIAKRYIAPLRKEANVAVSAQWTLYL